MSRHPRDIRFNADPAEDSRKQAAPGNVPARCIYPRPWIRSHSAHRAASRWVIPGSRQLRHFVARRRASANIALVVRSRAKRLPSRRWEQMRLINVRTRRIELHRAGLFPGAACCDILWPDGALVRISPWSSGHVQSGSPSRRWEQIRPVNVPTPFENEVDDEFRSNPYKNPTVPLFRFLLPQPFPQALK